LVTAVSLREITCDPVRAVCALEVGPDQRGFVSTNALSIAEAYLATASRRPARSRGASE
jgi:hypothetical protein